MRHLSSALVHGLGWLQKTPEGRANLPSTRLASTLLSVARPMFNRRLDEGWDEFDEDGDGFDPFSLLMDEEFNKELETCNIDAAEIMGLVMGAAGMMGGGDQLGMDDDEAVAEFMLGNGGNRYLEEDGDDEYGDDEYGDDEYGDDEYGDDIAGTLQDYGQMLVDMLSAEGEDECNKKQTRRFKKAFKDFYQCTGWDKLGFEEMSDNFFDDLSETCDSLASLSALPSNGLDPDQSAACATEVLGDNPLGNLMRDLYHGIDKNCACVAALGDAVPNCIVKDAMSLFPDLELPTDGETPIPEIPLPGSLIKTAACLVGLGCKHVDDLCEAEVQGLETCLPPLSDVSEASCEDVTEDCKSEGASTLDEPMQGIVLLTEGTLPDACQRVYASGESETDLFERYHQFSTKCASAVSVSSAESTAPEETPAEVPPSEESSSGDEPATEESTTEELSSSEESSSESEESSSEEPETPSIESFTSEKEYVPPVEAELPESSSSESEDKEEESGGSGGSVPILAVLGVVGVAAAAFFVHKRRTRTKPNRREFTGVGVDEEDTETEISGEMT